MCRLATIAALVPVWLLAGGCGDDGGRGEAVDVVATTTIAADLVRNVGGQRVDVHTILPANADPHEYEPRPSDAREVAGADLVVRSGGDLDSWLGDVLENAGGDATELTLIDSLRTAGGDPHWWQDPRNAERAVAAIAERLAKADPGGADAYRANAREYSERLARLDRSTAACIDRVPPAERKLVTTHDGLGHYARRYGIEIVGALIPSRSSQAQPSLGGTERLVQQIRREKVKAIFPERGLGRDLEQAVSREAGAKIGPALWTDALGPKDSEAPTYIDMVRANTRALVDGFTGGARSCDPRA